MVLLLASATDLNIVKIVELTWCLLVRPAMYHYSGDKTPNNLVYHGYAFLVQEKFLSNLYLLFRACQFVIVFQYNNCREQN